MDEQLLSIVYVSSAKQLLTDEELQGLLQTTRPKNEQLGISGVLLYGDGNFMQLLEGPESAVREVYVKICQDPRHHMVTTILEEPGLPREFAEWSMAYRRVDAPDWLLLTQALGPEGARASLSSIKIVLADFWKSVA